MNVSELKEKKLIHRPTQNFDLAGNRIYDVFEYNLPVKTNYDGNERERIFAKLIDSIPFFLTFYFIFGLSPILSALLLIPSVILFGSVTETVFGTTLGKKVFKIKVIDDSANNPAIFKSFLRNTLCLVVFYMLFADYIPPLNEILGIKHRETNFTMHMNNILCKTYIVKEYQVKEIKMLLKQSLL
ncbi:RDD family protein [Chryseobacterium caseinilyticum]|uniref:RDD family protein n=1 Tax=Chryseobacterium caseinilyticum TaxID=2771428 RepID=A0ABR8Z7U9_9FLAO|nr:RDD family protein [Chryseobacterium caseinilyticum]MBD8081315.1 RDD family protein [Chryseobacterium caseinilyticum]